MTTQPISEDDLQRAKELFTDDIATVRDMGLLLTELDRLHTWDGLMSLLDKHWPEGLFPKRHDIDESDPGPCIVSLLRWLDELQADNRRMADVVAENAELHYKLAETRREWSRALRLPPTPVETREEWAIRVITSPGGSHSYHNYCDPEDPERDLALTLQVLADGHDGFGNPVPHGPVSIVKRTVHETAWETVRTVEPIESPDQPEPIEGGGDGRN
jgi:hypothetical protein